MRARNLSVGRGYLAIGSIESRALIEAAVGGRAKRLMDVITASITLVLAAPLMIVVWLLVFMVLGSPAIFAHTRVGQTGRRFRCLKYRTMVRDSDGALRRHLAENPHAANEWARKQKLQNDPRVTRLGSFLRKSSIDELPQLFNVLRGDMSCVGPRPVVPDELSKYGTYAIYYLCARPGITGLWQTSGRSTLSYAKRVELDVQYVKRWSLAMDFKILLRTVAVLLRPGQAV